MQNLLTYFKSITSHGTSAPRCFCGRLASLKLRQSRYYYCPDHALDTTTLYRRWFRRGGESRFGT